MSKSFKTGVMAILILMAMMIASGVFSYFSVAKKLTSLSDHMTAVVNAGQCDVEINALPFEILKPGRYCLNNSLHYTDLNEQAVIVSSDNVTLIGNNHCIYGSRDATATSVGVSAIDYSYLTIDSLCLDGFHYAVVVGDTYVPEHEDYANPDFQRQTHDITLKNLTISNPLFQGLHVRADNVLIENNFVRNVGGTTVYPNSFATGIDYRGVNCRISKNHIRNLKPVDNGEGVGIAVSGGDGCVVEDNVISNRYRNEFSQSFGIWSDTRDGHGVLIKNNYIRGVSYGLGPFGILQGNVLTDIACNTLVDRVQDIDPLTLPVTHLHDNLLVKGAHQSDKAQNLCSDIKSYTNDFAKSPSANAAYKIIMVYSNMGQNKYAKEIFKWAVVADHYGHNLAPSVMEAYEEITSVREREEAREDAMKIIELNE